METSVAGIVTILVLAGAGLVTLLVVATRALLHALQ